MDKELEVLESNQVWLHVKRASGGNALHTKCVQDEDDYRWRCCAPETTSRSVFRNDQML